MNIIYIFESYIQFKYVYMYVCRLKVIVKTVYIWDGSRHKRHSALIPLLLWIKKDNLLHMCFMYRNTEQYTTCTQTPTSISANNEECVCKQFWGLCGDVFSQDSRGVLEIKTEREEEPAGKTSRTHWDRGRDVLPSGVGHLSQTPEVLFKD